jgi:hypothetical protein
LGETQDKRDNRGRAFGSRSRVPGRSPGVVVKRLPFRKVDATAKVPERAVAPRSRMNGRVLPIREGVGAAPTDLTDAIGLAFRMASSKLASRCCAVPRQQACRSRQLSRDHVHAPQIRIQSGPIVRREMRHAAACARAARLQPWSCSTCPHLDPSSAWRGRTTETEAESTGDGHGTKTRTSPEWRAAPLSTTSSP